MDIQMPEMDGLTATKHIRTNMSLTQLPIIALTANVMMEEVEEYIAAGMNAHIGKPFSFNTFIKVLEDVLK